MDNPIQTTVTTVAGNPDTTKLVAVAGLMGSLLSMSFVDGMSKKQRLIAIVSGMIMAHYLAPMIAFLFHEVDYQETVGFLIGLFGMSICSAIFRAIQHSDIWGLIEERWGKKEGQ